MKSPDRRGPMLTEGSGGIGRDGQQGRRNVAASPAGSPPAEGPVRAPAEGRARTGPRTADRLHAGREPSQQATAREHAMSLSRCEQSRFRRIEASLRRSDPKLADMPGVFGRLCAGQHMPTWEQAPSCRPDPAAALLAAATAVARLLLATARALAAIAYGGRARPSAPETGRLDRSRETGG
jgi:hypothetical protein